MCSAHRLTERSIWVKFNENRPKGSRGMRRTRKCYGRKDRLTDWLTDGLTDEGHSYNPLPLGGGGLKTVRLSTVSMARQRSIFCWRAVGGPLFEMSPFLCKLTDRHDISISFLGESAYKICNRCLSANGFLPGTQYFPKTTKTKATGQHSIPVIKV